MKVLFLLLLMLPVFAFAQKVKSQSTGQIGELKDLIGNYCIITCGKPFSNTVQVQTDDDDVDFVEDESGKKIKFKTIVSILNFMDKNGWEYVDTHGDPLRSYVFKRKK